MTRVSAAIQAHPRRAHLADALLGCLLGQAEIVYDPEPDGYKSPWRCYREALLRTPEDATHRLIIQEDVLICDGFLPAVFAIARAVPDVPVCLYVSGHPFVHARTVQDAHGAGSSYAEITNLTWVPVVATLWPTSFALPLVDWVDRMFAREWPPTFVADDEICGRYLRHRGVNALASVPSLVEHPDTEVSIMRRQVTGGLDATRRAALWIGDLGICDAREIDWSRS